MRAWSQILTVRQGFESSAPSPIHTSSQSTLAAKQMLPWTPSTSVSFGSAAFRQCCLSAWSEMDCREGASWQRLSGQGTQYHWKLVLPCHLMLIRLLIRTKWGCSVWRFAIFTASPRGLLLSPTYEVKCSFKCAFEHWKTNRGLQRKCGNHSQIR